MSRWKYFVRLVAPFALLTATACGGCGKGNNGGRTGDVAGDMGPEVSMVDPDVGPLVECGSDITGTVEAASWMDSLSDVRSYRYTGGFGDNELAVEFLDEGESALGEMIVSQVAVDDGEYPRGTMIVDAGDVQLIERGEGTDDGYFVRTTLTNGRQSVDVVASYLYTACAPEETDTPPCAGPLDVGAPGYTVGSCGLVWLTARQFGLFPRLDSVRYEVDGESVSGAPSVGGVRVDSTGRDYTLDVLRDGVIADDDTVGDWLRATGASAIIGSDTEQLVTPAYMDTAWREAFREHIAECTIAEGEGLAWAKLEGCQSSTVRGLAGLETHRQAQGPSCDSAARRDEPAWSESSESNGSQSCASGCSRGDPHLVSFDEQAFDFQGAGEFILAESTSGDPFVVQGRMETMGDPPLPICEDVTVNTAVAFEIGERRIAIYSRREPALWIDGSPVQSGPDVEIDLPEGAGFELDGAHSRFWWPGGESVRYRVGAYSSIQIALPSSRSGEIRGLLGTFSGNQEDDYTSRLGEELTRPLSFDDLYQRFGESWRVRPFETLFDYDAGESTETFTITDFPEGPTDPAEIPPAEREAALETCGERDIVDPWLFEACILDVVCSSDGNAADAADQIAGLESPEEVTVADDVSYTVAGAVRSREDVESLEGGEIAVESTCRDDISSVIWLVPEREAVDLTSNVSVDATDPGAYLADGDLSSGMVAAGTTVWSYALHFDLDGRREAVPATGSVTFSEPIAGVIVKESSLSSTDGALGVEGATYPSDRAAELGEDSFEISADGRKLIVKMGGETNIDQLRVIVAPEEMQ